jgi:predicted RNase H-like HicB family nuclease
MRNVGQLITEAETLEEAFANARDAAEALRESRKKVVS